jgi:hypothetical protein
MSSTTEHGLWYESVRALQHCKGQASSTFVYANFQTSRGKEILCNSILLHVQIKRPPFRLLDFVHSVTSPCLDPGLQVPTVSLDRFNNDYLPLL